MKFFDFNVDTGVDGPICVSLINLYFIYLFEEDNAH